MSSASTSLLGGVITFACAHLSVLNAAKLHGDLAKLTIPSLVRRIVTKAVLGADLVRYLCESRAGILQSRRGKILAPELRAISFISDRAKL